MSTVKYNVPGISCGHCKMAIEGALNDLGVAKAVVNIDAKTVETTFEEPITEDQVKSAIQDQGYDIE